MVSKEVGIVGLEIFFFLLCGFTFWVVAPLYLVCSNNLASGDPFRDIENFNWPLHIGEVFLEIKTF